MCVCVGVFGRVCLIWSAVCSAVMSHHVRHVRKLIVDNDPECTGANGYARTRASGRHNGLRQENMRQWWRNWCDHVTWNLYEIIIFTANNQTLPTLKFSLHSGSAPLIRCSPFEQLLRYINHTAGFYTVGAGGGGMPFALNTRTSASTCSVRSRVFCSLSICQLGGRHTHIVMQLVMM